MHKYLTKPLKLLTITNPQRFCRFFCDFTYKHSFSKDEEHNILKTINSSSPEYLSRYSIAKYRLQRIKHWKQQHGEFQSLSDILKLDDFGVKVLDKFCQSILKDSTESSEKTSVTAVQKSPQILTPKLTEDKRMNIKSCCSIQIGTNSISWCCLEVHDEAPTVVTHWDYVVLNVNKSHLSNLSHRILQVSQMIPECSAYVLETPIIRQSPPNANAIQISVNIQQAQLLAMITVILEQRMIEPCVYFIRKYVDARLFGTLIGNERTSSLDVVKRILAQDVDNQIEPLPNILAKYNAKEGTEKEYMGRSLMLAASFLRLCVLKCSKSLATISRRSKN